MSASREKKNRQDLASQGIKDPKAIREAEEKAKLRKANRLYGTIAVVFVVVAALLLVVKSGVLYRDPDAVTIDGQNYTAAQVNYYYRGLANNIAQAGYYGLDNSKPLTQQVMNDTAKMLLQVTDEGDVTWDQFLKEYAVKQLSLRAMVVKEAEANGMGADDAIKAEVQETISSLKESLKPEGYSLKSYLKLAYGQGMTPSLFEELLTADEVTSHYMQHYEESLTYTVDELEADYQEHPATFDVASYEYIYFKGSAPSTTDADGNTVDPTEEETAAALEEAKTLADSLYAQYQEGSLLAKLAESDDKASYSSNDKASYSDSVLMNWLFDSARQPGDSDVLFNESASTYYVVRFNERYRDEVKTVDVRHILIQVDEDGLDSEADDYDTQLQARKDEAKAKADEILAQWKSGDATEDSFAALANEYSEDPGSNTTGGLYTQVTKGSMVTAFDEWIFDDSRKSGDADIVYAERTSSGSDYKGYHIIYFVGDDLPAWQVTVTNALKNADYNDWYSQQTGDEEITLVDKGVAKVG